MSLNNKKVHERIKGNQERYEKWNSDQSLWNVAKAILRGKFVNTNLPQEKKTSNRQSNFTHKWTRKNPKLVEEERNNKNQGRNKGNTKTLKNK